MADYITGTNHAETLVAALNRFHEALTRRWRERVCEAIVEDREFPTVIRRPVSPHGQRTLWNYRSLPARAHLAHPDGCAYLHWVTSGQRRPLSAVRCDGATVVGGDQVDMLDRLTGRMVTIPPTIDCGVGDILAQVEDWAWGERDHVFYQLPLFDHHSVPSLESAYHAFVRFGRRLGLLDQSEDARTVDARELPVELALLADADGGGQDWWAGWTGLAAERVRSGFFASVAPTVRNQSAIAGCLAALHSDRAAIIEKGRNDGLRWIEWATRCLGESEVVTTDLTTGWKVVQGVGAAVAIGGALATPVGIFGSVLALGGFLGENLYPSHRSVRYARGFEEVVATLNDGLRELEAELERHEFDYAAAASRLRYAIFGCHSYHLELYDLTANNPMGDGDGSDTGYEADLDDIMRIAENCYEAGAGYERLLSVIRQASDADRHLADKDGNPTRADRTLLEIRDLLEQFVMTTCGRFIVAADQIRKAAERYAATDEERAVSLQRLVGDWNKSLDEVSIPFDPHQAAAATDRGRYDPFRRHPALGGRGPGVGDGLDYVTEED